MSVLILTRSYDYEVFFLNWKFLTSGQIGYASVIFSYMTQYQLSLVHLIKTLLLCIKIQLPFSNQKDGNYWKAYQDCPQAHMKAIIFFNHHLLISQIQILSSKHMYAYKSTSQSNPLKFCKAQHYIEGMPQAKCVFDFFPTLDFLLRFQSFKTLSTCSLTPCLRVPLFVS